MSADRGCEHTMAGPDLQVMMCSLSAAIVKFWSEFASLDYAACLVCIEASNQPQFEMGLTVFVAR